MIVLQEHSEATEVPGNAIEDVAVVYISDAAHMSISIVGQLMVEEFLVSIKVGKYEHSFDFEIKKFSFYCLCFFAAAGSVSYLCYPFLGFKRLYYHYVHAIISL